MSDESTHFLTAHGHSTQGRDGETPGSPGQDRRTDLLQRFARAEAEVEAATLLLGQRMTSWQSTLSALFLASHDPQRATDESDPQQVLAAYRSLFDKLAHLVELMDPYAVDLRQATAARQRAAGTF
ncbi:MAG: hypothetical protein ACKOYM_04335 [Actinomycetes bacterium]